jgi:RES domain-containing protein
VFDERRAEAVLQSAPLLSFDGYLTRFIYAAHQRTALEAVGAFHTGGRYNPPGVAALYTSYRRATALIEATQYLEDEDPIKPMLMMSVRLETAALLDLSDPSLLAELGTGREELTKRIPDLHTGTALPQLLGRVAEASGRIRGLIVWSRLLVDERNVELFPDRLGMSYELYDPAGDILTMHPAIADALRRLMEPPWL